MSNILHFSRFAVSNRHQNNDSEIKVKHHIFTASGKCICQLCKRQAINTLTSGIC